MAENTADTTEAADFPDWYDTAKHVAGPGGIYEAGNGVLLAEDGEPASLALRAARAALAEIAKPAKKSRDTRQTVEGAALASGANATSINAEKE